MDLLNHGKVEAVELRVAGERQHSQAKLALGFYELLFWLSHGWGSRGQLPL